MDFASHLKRYVGQQVTFSINDKNSLFTLDFSSQHLVEGTTVVIEEVKDDCIVVLYPHSGQKGVIHFCRLNILEPK